MKVKYYIPDKLTIYYLIIIMILLLPLLFMSISNDIAIFMEGGKTIANGGILYQDFIDIKPPFFFCIFSVIYSIFGFTELAPRIADILIQLTTIYILYKSLSLVYSDIFNRVMPGILYVIVYVSLGYSQMGYPESFMGMAISGLIYLKLRYDNNLFSLILSGIICGLISGMKYTFAIALIPSLIIFIYTKQNTFYKNFINISLFIFSFALTLLLSHFLIFINGSTEAFYDVIKIYNSYSGVLKFNVELIRSFFLEFSKFWGFQLSIIISAAFVISIYSYNDIKEIKLKKIIVISIVLFSLLLITVFIEKRFLVYMFSRLLIPICIISSYGFYMIYLKIIKNFMHINKIHLIAVIFVLLFFSPILKYSKSLLVSYNYFSNEEKYYNSYPCSDIGNCRPNYNEIADYIKNTTPQNQQIMIISNGASILTFLLDDYKQSAFAHSLFYLNNLKLKYYYRIFINEFNNSDVLIINNYDAHPIISGRNESSYELIKNNPVYNTILKNKYKEEISFNNFIIYRKKLD